MSIRVCFIHLILLLSVITTSSIGQISYGSDGNIPPEKPQWTDIHSVNVFEENGYLMLVMEMSDTIPHTVQDSSVFQFLLDSDSDITTGTYFDSLGVDHIIQFEHNNWDGSRWFSMFLMGQLDSTLWPGEKHRMFDWSLTDATLKVRLSLTALDWSSLRIKARVFYGDKFVDSYPDAGYINFKVDNKELSGLNVVSTKRTVFIYPAEFEPVITKNQIPFVLDAAYEFEEKLTGYKPVGGDTLRFIFHPLYDGAAIEGDPIYIGPGMWGTTALWFVYFHEMGHNFCNASARFAQLYPLQFSVPPGPLPMNILFYEAFATVPAMYVYEQIEQNKTIPGVESVIVSKILEEWYEVKTRFTNAYNKYKKDPMIVSVNPDIIDGLFLELKEEYGWDIFQKFYKLMSPPNHQLEIFNTRLPDDTPDLQKTRSTLTAAILSVAAGEDLSKRFEAWGFPINRELFNSTLTALLLQLNTPDKKNN
jgi:hypothetical protein